MTNENTTLATDTQLVNREGGNKYSFIKGQNGPITLDQIAEVGMFNYEVEKRPLYNANGDVVNGAHQVIRTDTNAHLAVVGEQFTPLQPKSILEVAMEMVNVAQGEFGQELTFESAGTARGGCVNYLQLKMPGFFSVLNGKDRTDQYLTLFNGHDGNTQLSISGQAMRLSCTNQIAAMKRGWNVSNRHTLRHTANVKQNFSALGRTLADQYKYYKLLNEAMDFLTTQPTSDDDAMRYFKATFKKEDVIDVESQEVTEQKFLALPKLMELRETGLGTDIPGVRGTRYGDYQALTEYLDHHQKTREGTDRFVRTNIGSDVQRVKNRALELTLS